ncbi:MAG: AmmeMemoRadiSam system protein A [Acidobacteria bacterium]|nr:AmmeMemoRadiSam system protein A [Acidobacteriota bacterium]MCB9398784.1 AmmeMemoRadiSam system protein A [Acidobacteriota bacterium]
MLNPAALAEMTIRKWVQAHEKFKLIDRAHYRAGCFVSLHERDSGDLRGCIGTIEPQQSDFLLEVRENAIAAATRDPRFEPVSVQELDDLTIEVSELKPPETIPDPEYLSPWRYGVVVEARGRRGVLLPALDGIDTAEQQIAIARRKAGLDPYEPVQLWRFEVVKHAE